MMGSKERAEAQNEGLRALSDKINKVEAERKSMYNIIDKLSGCLEETNRRFSQIIEQIEALENRITDIEIKLDNITHDQSLLTDDEEEEVNETG